MPCAFESKKLPSIEGAGLLEYLPRHGIHFKPKIYEKHEDKFEGTTGSSLSPYRVSLDHQVMSRRNDLTKKKTFRLYRLSSPNLEFFPRTQVKSNR